MVEQTSDDGRESEHSSLDPVFDCLSNSDRRRMVELVHDRGPEPVPRDELATAVAGCSVGKPRSDVTVLHHVHLPKLTAAGLVEHDTDDDTVALGDHRAFEDQGILEVLEGDVSASAESLDSLFGAIADSRRRTILDVLSHQFGSIHVETLAREFETYGSDRRPSEVPAEEVSRTREHLRHVELPGLTEAGLVEYNPEEETVAYRGHPQLRVPWMHSVLQPDFRGNLTGEPKPTGIGEIQGRERVISYGQSLCEQADDELFCMFTDTKLLETGCLARIRDASRRGVDVYLGTRDPVVKEYVLENALEVILWEPRTDWLNLPAAGDRVGRLLLADREAIMLGTLLEEKTAGLHEEQAIVDEGKHNTLVTMICQLLGPHLEEIDEGTEDIEARLPV